MLGEDRLGGFAMNYGFPMILHTVVDRMLAYPRRVFQRIKDGYLCWQWGIKSDSRVWFFGPTLIRTRHSGEIEIGVGVRFNARAQNNLVGLMGATVLDTRPGGKIVVGDRTGLSSVVISSRSRVEIGKDVKIGGNVRIFDHDFHAVEAAIRRTAQDHEHIRTRPISIGDDCFVGTNALILKGSRIGPRSIVAAGSVVCGLDVPPDSLVRGNPAIVVER